jgi:hypothetical protein
MLVTIIPQETQSRTTRGSPRHGCDHAVVSRHASRLKTTGARDRAPGQRSRRQLSARLAAAATPPLLLLSITPRSEQTSGSWRLVRMAVVGRAELVEPNSRPF